MNEDTGMAQGTNTAAIPYDTPPVEMHTIEDVNGHFKRVRVEDGWLYYVHDLNGTGTPVFVRDGLGYDHRMRDLDESLAEVLREVGKVLTTMEIVKFTEGALNTPTAAVMIGAREALEAVLAKVYDRFTYMAPPTGD